MEAGNDGTDEARAFVRMVLEAVEASNLPVYLYYARGQGSGAPVLRSVLPGEGPPDSTPFVAAAPGDPPEIILHRIGRLARIAMPDR